MFPPTLPTLAAAAAVLSLGAAAAPSANAAPPYTHVGPVGAPIHASPTTVYTSPTTYRYQPVYHVPPAYGLQPAFVRSTPPSRPYVVGPTPVYRPGPVYTQPQRRSVGRTNYLGGGPSFNFNRGRSRSPIYGFHRRPVGAFNTGNFRGR